MKLFLIPILIASLTSFEGYAKTGQSNRMTDSIKTITYKVKGISCSKDLKMITANVEKMKGVNSCKPGKKGTTTSFIINYNPLLVKESEILAAIENTGSCENPDDRPYKVKQ